MKKYKSKEPEHIHIANKTTYKGEERDKKKEREKNELKISIRKKWSANIKHATINL